jgi:hypothetical protein
MPNAHTFFGHTGLAWLGWTGYPVLHIADVWSPNVTLVDYLSRWSYYLHLQGIHTLTALPCSYNVSVTINAQAVLEPTLIPNASVMLPSGSRFPYVNNLLNNVITVNTLDETKVLVLLKLIALKLEHNVNISLLHAGTTPRHQPHATQVSQGIARNPFIVHNVGSCPRCN